MRQRVFTLVLALGLAGLPMLSATPAHAAGADRLVRCRGCSPAGFAFTPDGGTIFYTERFSGEIRRYTLADGKDSRWGRIRDLSRRGEQGLLGVALDPDWALGPEHQWVYVYYTEANPHRNVVARIRRDGRTIQRDIVLTLRASDYHDGGVIHFGPDGKLYVVTGDTQSPGLAQQRRHLAGKVLRVEQNGKRPSDNPIPRSKAYSYGHRNSFGFTFDPRTGNLWQTENGPECDDEVNLIRPGRNYGWGGGSRCPDTNDSGPNPVSPAARFNPVPALTGAAFCEGCGLAPEVEGDLLVGSYNDGKIRNLTLNPARDDVSQAEVLYDHPTVVLAVERAPDGRIYFSDPSGISLLRA